MQDSDYVAIFSLIVSIVIGIVNFYYTRKKFQGKDLLKNAIKDIGSVIDSIDHWTGPSFFDFKELRIATTNIIRILHDKELESLNIKIAPFFIEMYSRNLLNLREKPRYFKFNSESNLDEFLMAFKNGEPVGNRLYIKCDPMYVIPESIDLNCIWGLSQLNLSISKLEKYRDLIDPLESKLLNNLLTVVPNLIEAIFESLKKGTSEIEIDASMHSDNIYDLLYKTIFYWEYMDHTLSYLKGDFKESLNKVQKILFMKS